jgi:S1-C subfamily serine protease
MTSNKATKKKPSTLSKLKRTIAVALIALGLSTTLTNCGPSDTSIRSRVLKLVSSKGSCSGEQIKAPSGMQYILTAAHCKVLAVDGSIKVITEDGRELMRRVIEEDVKSDLLLLEGAPGIEGLSVADDLSPRDHIRTFTHGYGMATYKTEGVIIQDMRVQIAISAVLSPEDQAKCEEQPKQKVMDAGWFGKMCAMDVVETATTALILPGSSGGPVVNDRGELVGVVSAGDGVIGMLVKISDINDFISSY